MKKKVIIGLLAVIVILIIVVIVANVFVNTEEETAVGGETLETSKGYSIKYNGVDITPGTAFDEDAIDEDCAFSEITSCAFDGTDKSYNYGDFEVVVAEIDGVDTVYSVYFLTDEIETTEGVKITDSIDTMIETYGEDYTNSLENTYDYDDGNATLSFIVNGDTIVSIEYILDV